METKNDSKVKYWLAKGIQVVGLIALSFAVLISCQKKNDSGSVYATPAPVSNAGLLGTCAGCTFAQVQIGTPTSRYGSYLTIQWDLIGDQAAAQTAVAYGTSLSNYTGQIAARGVMQVASPITFGGGYGYGIGYGTAYGCQLAAGQYQLNTLQVGQSSSGSFSIPQIEAVGVNGVRIVFSLTTGVLIGSGTGTVASLGAQLVPVAAIYNGQQIACSDVGIYVSN
ncbi:MAG: hypothetical protein JNL11_03350 [Bdellovibrionaceae bacterium]|nr:hypothetical protein [Pseudobdellovibrionaceae bacterium]